MNGLSGSYAAKLHAVYFGYSHCIFNLRHVLFLIRYGQLKVLAGTFPRLVLGHDVAAMSSIPTLSLNDRVQYFRFRPLMTLLVVRTNRFHTVTSAEAIGKPS